MGNLTSEIILVVDLTNGETYKENINDEFYQVHIGGAAANKALYDKYADDDPIVLGTGLLTGTLVPGSSLGVITAKSPRTGKICHAPFNLSGGMELKYTGFDFVVVKGVSKKPVYLWLHDSVADIKDASALWGKDTWTTTDTLRKNLGEDLIQILGIGEAGEKCSDLAQIILNYWSTGDRWGFGALLGQKNVKAIAMRGMGLFDMDDENGFLDLCFELLSEVKRGGLSGKEGIVDIANELSVDITDWLSPVFHRNSSCFNTPYPANTFLKFNEDPKILKETDVAEPGVLVTDIFELLEFKEAGLSALDTAEILQTCLKFGIDPVAVAQICIKDGKMSSPAEIKNALGDLKGSVNTTGTGSISPCCPKRPLFFDFGLSKGSDTAKWWERRQAEAYIFGINQIFALMSPFLSTEKLIELVNLGTGLGITKDSLNNAIDTL